MSLLTIAEIAKRTGIPDSTVRYYRDRFEPWLSYVGAGRDRRYDESSVEVLRFVADAIKAGVPMETIRQRLSERFPVTEDADVPQPPATTTQQQTTAAVLDALRFVVAELLDQQRAAIVQEIGSLGDQVVALRGVANQIKAVVGDELRISQQTALAQTEIIAGLLDKLAASEARAAQLDAQLDADLKAARERPWWKWWQRILS